MTHIRMILKHLCLSGMLDIIQSKRTLILRILYLATLVMFSMLLISHNFDAKLIILFQFWPGSFSQNCWKKPCLFSINYDYFLIPHFKEVFWVLIETAYVLHVK